MQITKKPQSGSRKVTHPPPDVRDFLAACTKASEAELPALLRSFGEWRYPKGDLFQYIELLNSFDSLLERICKQHKLERMQKQSFSTTDRELLCTILEFTAFLLDHCANRALYSSSAYIDQLLNTTDDVVLEIALKVTYRVAQRFGLQKSTKTQFTISIDRLTSLAMPHHYSTKERSIVSVPMEEFLSRHDGGVPAEWQTIVLWFYRTVALTDQQTKPDYFSSKTPAKERADREMPATPTPGHRMRSANTPAQTPKEALPGTPGASLSTDGRKAEGQVVIELPRKVTPEDDFDTLLQYAIDYANVPEMKQFWLVQRLRFARAAGDYESRCRLTTIRLLAVASLGCVVNNYVLRSRVLSHDEQLLKQLGALLASREHMPEIVVTAALATLDAIARHQAELNDVLSLLGAGVSHGLLMRIVQQTFAALQSETPTVGREFVETLMNHLHYLTTTNVAGNMLCSAGLVQALIGILKNHNRAALRAVIKSLTLLDHLLYGHQQSFNIFVHGQGPQVLVDRIAHEVQYDLEAARADPALGNTSTADYRMPHERFSVLKTMLKFLLHMMQGVGTADGLRNLIETSLLQSLNQIFNAPDVFGSSAFANASNVMATFIHNEPTSYQILHENKVPETFCRAVSQAVLPAQDAVLAVPHAIGAICLHSQGMDLVNELKPISAFFRVFSTPKHVEVLRENDIANVLGGSVDELIRHHPSLKDQILEDVMQMLRQVVVAGQDDVRTAAKACRFKPVNAAQPQADVNMTDASQATDTQAREKQATIVSMVEVSARFLEGVFQNSTHAREMIQRGVVSIILSYYSLPGLPYDFAKSHAALSASHIVRLLSEIQPHQVVEAIFETLDVLLGSLRGLVAYAGEQTFFAPFLSLDTDSSVGDEVAQNLRKLHSLGVLLSDLYAVPVFSNGRSTTTFYAIFSGSQKYAQLLDYLGQVHRQLIWQDIVICRDLSNDWIKATQPKDDPAEPESATEEPTPANADLPEADLASPRFYNLKMLRFFLCQTPPCILPFFQGLSKMLVGRRTMDAQQRAVSLGVAEQIAHILQAHLSWNNSGWQMSASDKHSYWMMMLSTTQMIVLDEHNSQVLTTAVLMFFDKGIDIMLQMLTELWSLTSDRKAPDSEADGTEAAKIAGSTKLILHMLQSLTSRKAVTTSPQSIALSTGEKDREVANHFNSGDFLRKLRGKIFPVAAEIWSAQPSKLSTSSLKNLITIVRQCIKKESEVELTARHETFASLFTPNLSIGSVPRLRAAPSVNTNLIRLQGLGYSVETATDALQRHQNDYSAALGYLVNHPEPGANQSASNATSTDRRSSGIPPTSAVADVDVAMDSAEPEPEPEAEVVPNAELIEKTREDAIMNSIELLSSTTEVVFQLSELIMAAAESSTDSSVVADGAVLLSGAVFSLKQDCEESARANHLGAVCHLFAKLAHEPTFLSKCASELVDSLPTIFELMDLGDEPPADVPVWLAPCFLLADAVLADSRGPYSIVLDKSGTITSTSMAEHCELDEETITAMFNLCLTNLRYRYQNQSWLFSVLRLLVRLTQHHKYAEQLIKRNGFKDLYALLKHNISSMTTQDADTFRALALLLRHVAEPDDVLARLMRHELAPRMKSGNMDILNFVDTYRDVALRNPKVFVDMVAKEFCLPSYNAQLAVQSISLRPMPDTPPAESATENAEAAPSGEAGKQSSGLSMTPRAKAQSIQESPTGIIHFLVSELFSQRDDVSREETATKAPGDNPEQPADKVAFKAADYPEFMYRQLLLSSCAEVLSSYTAAKLEFVDYSRKSQAAESITNFKTRSSALNLFINDFIALGSTTSGDENADLKRMATCLWATRCIYALCLSCEPGEPEKDVILVQVQKMTLDALSKAFRDAISSTEIAAIRYARFMALSELTHRLFTPDDHLMTSTLRSSQNAKQITKLLLEKNFVSILTQVMAEVDLQHPNSRKVIRAVLRPLKHLTKSAVQLSESDDLQRPFVNPQEQESIDNELAYDSDADDDDNDSEQEREETPDLYRNSALGIFGGDVQEDEEPSDYDEDEEEGMYDEEMEYEEDASQTGSAVSDEEMDLDANDADEVIEFMVEHDHSDDEDDDDGEGSSIESTSDDDDDDDDDDEDGIDMDDDELQFDGSMAGDDEDNDESDWEDEPGDGDAEAETESVGVVDAAAASVFVGVPRIGRRILLGDDAAETITIPITRTGLIDGQGNFEEERDEDDDDSTSADELGLGDLEEAFPGDEDAEDEEADEEAWEGWEIEQEPPSGRSRRNATHGFFSGGAALRRQPDPLLRRSGAYGVGHRHPTTRNAPFAHPLLTAPPEEPAGGAGREIRGDNFSEWVESIENLIGGGAVSLINDIMARRGVRPGAPIRVTVPNNGDPNSLPPELGRLIANAGGRFQQGEVQHHHHHHHHHGGAAEDSQSFESPNHPLRASDFAHFSTGTRWAEEVSMLHNGYAGQRARPLANHILHAMIPTAAREAEVREQEQAEKTKADEERRARERAEEVEAEEKRRREAEEAEQAAERERRETEAHAPTVEEHVPETEVEASPDADEPMQDVATSDAVESAPAQQQSITIRGRSVNITGLGIDQEFLEALPDDMREEVLTQHIRERRAAAQESHQASAAELSPEFLEALPADIRAELLQQEAQDRRRRERQARQSGARPSSSGGTAGPAEIDPASFLASLDPALRESVLLEQDDDFLDQLPPEMLAEINPGRLRSLRELELAVAERATRVVAAQGGEASAPAGDEPAAQPKARREVIQLLDKAGIASLVRLLFIPTQTARSHLNDVLANLCENRSSRLEIINHLLIILQEGTLDHNSVEKCFHAITRRSRTLPTGETPAKTPRKQAKHAVPFTAGDNLPNTIATQCLVALSHLISHNSQLATFFLTEHESLASRRQVKGKAPKSADESSVAQNYAINVLIGLLDRDSLLSSATSLETLAHLLSTITRPLVVLKRRQKAARANEDVEMETEAATATATTAETSAGDAAGAAGPSSATPTKKKVPAPPVVPQENLALVVRILTADECLSKTFQFALATMLHLTALDGAKEHMASQLVDQAQTFSLTLRRDLANLRVSLPKPGAGQGDIDASILKPFSTSTSDQTKLLRILKSIDYLYDEKRLSSSGADTQEIEAAQIYVKRLYEGLQFTPLWSELSETLWEIHEHSNQSAIATMLLPLIEALMVVCKNTVSAETARGSSMSRQATPAVDNISQLFFTFTEEHKKVLNQMVRNNPSLMSGSFALLVRNPKVLEFDNKRNFFIRRLRDRTQRDQYQPLSLQVRREMVFLDSYQKLYFKSGDEIKHAKLNIRFAGEEGVDAGGVTREWYQVLARQMFDPNYALFIPVNSDRNTYHPNKLSSVNPEHLSFFKFVGRIVGKALYDGRLLDCHFSRPLYRKMLGKNVSLKDMETLDLEYYNSLRWMLDNDITDVITESFSIETDDFGETKVIDLIPNGRNVAVTEENKQDYVARVTEYRLLESVSEQLDHFMKGFSDIIPHELISIFTEQEVELLISGLPDIDADDWRNNTEYHNYTASSPQILWFWRCVRAMDDEERARLLQFCTGSARLPIEGFKHLEGMSGVQKFNIHRAYGEVNRLPQSHTCFNQLDLPEYETYEQLRTALMTACTEGSEGFGFA